MNGLRDDNRGELVPARAAKEAAASASGPRRRTMRWPARVTLQPHWILAAALLVAMTGPVLARPIVVFLSDFGIENEAVAICHGAILSINSEIEVVDLTHQIPPFNIRAGGAALSRATTFPARTVFLAVVDPGVGTSRRAVAVASRDGLVYVAPDNGLLSEVIRRHGVLRAVQIDEKKVNPRWTPGTFDGRDLLAPAAALLASGRELTGLGTPIDSVALVMLSPVSGGTVVAPGTVEGIYARTDEPYGNIWTDITREATERAGIAPGAILEVTIGSARIVAPLVLTYGDVPEGKPLAYYASDGCLAFALNLGDLRRSLSAHPGEGIRVRRVEASAAPSAPPGR
jgi:S-adenosyl-L-methionine hydrolase (adenosine-forming)